MFVERVLTFCIVLELWTIWTQVSIKVLLFISGIYLNSLFITTNYRIWDLIAWNTFFASYSTNVEELILDNLDTCKICEW